MTKTIASIKSIFWCGFFGAIISVALVAIIPSLLTLGFVLSVPQIFGLILVYSVLIGFFEGIIGGTVSSPAGWGIAGFLVSFILFAIAAEPPENAADYAEMVPFSALIAWFAVQVGTEVHLRWPATNSHLATRSKKKRYTIALVELIMYAMLVSLLRPHLT